MFSVHTKTKSQCFQIPPVSRAFSTSSVFVISVDGKSKLTWVFKFHWVWNSMFLKKYIPFFLDAPSRKGRFEKGSLLPVHNAFTFISIHVDAMNSLFDWILLHFICRPLQHSSWFRRQACHSRSPDSLYLLQPPFVTLAWPIEPPVVMECTH